jgi:hypothetical protein
VTVHIDAARDGRPTEAHCEICGEVWGGVEDLANFGLLHDPRDVVRLSYLYTTARLDDPHGR